MLLANIVRRLHLTPYEGFSESDFEFEDVWLHSLPKQTLAAYTEQRRE